MTFSTASIDAVDQSVGRNRKVGTLALIGGGGALIAAFLTGKREHLAGYTAIGAMAGGFIGFFVGSEDWERVPFDEIGAGVGSNNGLACLEVRIRY